MVTRHLIFKLIYFLQNYIHKYICSSLKYFLAMSIISIVFRSTKHQTTGQSMHTRYTRILEYTREQQCSSTRDMIVLRYAQFPWGITEFQDVSHRSQPPINITDSRCGRGPLTRSKISIVKIFKQNTHIRSTLNY